MQFWNILLPYTMQKHVLRREHNYVNKNRKLLSPYIVIATAIGKGYRTDTANGNSLEALFYYR